MSATGSCEMGKALAPLVAERMGKGLYELGGNNAMIVSEHANLDLAKRAIVFSAVGTCGQRCTTLRRLIVHRSKYDELLEALKKSYSSLPIGDPIKRENLVGPLINQEALDRMQNVLNECREQGYTVHGGEPLTDLGEGFVQPAIVEVPEQCDIVRTETFAPILYTMKYTELDEAIAIQNDVPQGLSSCIFTDNVQEAENNGTKYIKSETEWETYKNNNNLQNDDKKENYMNWITKFIKPKIKSLLKKKTS